MDHRKEKKKNMLERIKTILAEFTDADLSGVTEETDVQYELGFDSLQIMNLAVALEQEFGVNIDDDDAAAIITVADIVRLVS